MMLQIELVLLIIVMIDDESMCSDVTFPFIFPGGFGIHTAHRQRNRIKVILAINTFYCSKASRKAYFSKRKCR